MEAAEWPTSRTHTVSEALSCPPQGYVRILGWVSSKSSVGGVTFAVIRDGSGYIQAAGKKGITRDEVLEVMKVASKETAVSVGGFIQDDLRAPGGKEISIRELEIIATAEKWPITKSSVRSVSYLYDKRHLSIRGKKAIAIMKVRAEIVRAAFEFFVKRGFTLVSAPTFVKNACEGGSTLFELDYFGQKAYLSQSAQFYEEAAISAVEKVFIFQPAFRAEKSKTAKHLTEFWMIEAEQAFATQEDNIRLQEALVYHMTQGVAENRKKELEVLGRKFVPPEPPFPRISYDEVNVLAEKRGMSFEWGEDLPTEVERLISRSFEKPVFVTGYPLSARSFYHMTKPDNPQITLSADLLAPEGFGEIATGGQRIHDYDLLVERLKGQDLPAEAFDWYLELRRYGLPPHSGFGLGVERTTRWVSSLKHIRATSLFPRTITRVTP